MKVVFSGGGTGGHVYPALSVATALLASGSCPTEDMLYAGRANSAEQQLAIRHGLAFRAFHAGPLRGRSPLKLLAGLVLLCRGVFESCAILRMFQPGAVFATGGYASMPMAVAARLTRTPLLVFLPDVYPGWAVRVAGRLAALVATSTEVPLHAFPAGRTIVTGYPLRPEFASTRRDDARRRLGLGSGPVLLVTGASTGSLALNDAVLEGLPELVADCEILHLTGAADAPRVLAARQALESGSRQRYHVLAYLDAMADAMAAADLAVMRAGASCLGEPAAFGLPVILIPGPFSDQRRNAEYVARNGAGVLLDQSALAQRLAPLVHELLTSPDTLQRMADASRRLSTPLAAMDLAGQLLRLGNATRSTEPCLR